MRRCFLSSFLGLLVLLGTMPAFSQAVLAKGIIEGTVVNSVTNEPIAGARVRVTLQGSHDDPEYAKTDEQGRFTFSNLTGPGPYVLSGDHPGFMRWQESVDGLVTVPAYLKLGDDGLHHGTATIPLFPYAVIHGKVTDPNGMPLPNTPMEIYVMQNGLVRINGTTANDLGEYRLAPLKPGTYYVAATKTRNAPAAWDTSYHATYFPAAVDLAQAQAIELHAGQTAQADIQIVRLAGARVAGRLTLPAIPEKPAGTYRSTYLLLTDPKNHVLNADTPNTMSDSDTFEFSHIPPGEYTLTAVTRETPAGSSARDKVKVIFGARSEVTVSDHGLDGVQVEMKPMPDIQGRITYAEGCTPTPALIGVYTQGPNLSVGSGEYVPNVDGTFVMTNLTPARLMLNVRAGANRLHSARFGDTDVLTDGFDYPPASPAELQITMSCGRSQ